MKKAIACVLVFCIIIGLSGCLSAVLFPREFRLDQEESAISAIEIIHADPQQSGENGAILQTTVAVVEDKVDFMKQFRKVTCHETMVIASPNGLVSQETVIKIIYSNGDYQLIGPHAQASYYAEADDYDHYRGFFYFDDGEFAELITRYTE